MVVTKEHVGDVICQYESGERFMINNVSDKFLFLQQENGTCECAASHTVNGGIERDDARIASFHTNLALARALEAAETAARRRLTPSKCDELDRQEASRVLDVVKSQRATFYNRLKAERRSAKAGPALAGQFLDNLIQEGPGACAVFFGVTVQNCGGLGPSFRVNGGAARSEQEAAAFLGELTAKPKTKVASFEDLIALAKDRAAQQKETSRLSYDINR